MPLDPWISNNFLDSCAFDPAEPESEAANEIYKISLNSDLGIMIAHSTQKEIEHPNTPRWVKDRANDAIYTLETSQTPSERVLYTKILDILAGDGMRENMAQDATHIFEAQKYGSYFITTEGRLLKKAPILRKLCGVEVILPSEFLVLVRKSK